MYIYINQQKFELINQLIIIFRALIFFYLLELSIGVIEVKNKFIIM